MTARPSETRGRVAVIGGLHAWPLLRAHFDEVHQVPGVAGDCARAEEYVDPEYGPAVLAPVQLALDGELDRFAALVVARDHATVFAYLQELHRRGTLPGLPPLHLFDAIVDDTPSARDRTREEVVRLRAFVERTSGRARDDAGLPAALDAERELADALRTLQRRRAAGAVRGTTAKDALARRRDVDPAEAAVALAAVPDDAPADAVRVVLVPTRSTRDSAVHALVEEHGGVVVAEDDWYGSRSIAAAPVAAAGDEADALTELVLAEAATDKVAPLARRLAWLEATLASGSVDALVILTDPADAWRGWDAPHLARLAEEHGVRVARIHASFREAQIGDAAREEFARAFAPAAGKARA